MRASTKRVRGFTLVELLVVIAIIATLAAILTPAVMRALITAVDGAIKLEVNKLQQGIEQYKNEYGDYPPDFSDPDIVRRHYRKLFPRMAADERQVLEHILTEEGVDRAEALFFALHGYSSDVTHPFTGPGGPLAGTQAAGFNIGDTLVGSEGMTNSMIEFTETYVKWTLSGTSYTSTDDGDVFPTYVQQKTDTPFVYFDSRTYITQDSSANAVLNSFSDPHNSLAGTAQPYKSDLKTPKADPDETGLWAPAGVNDPKDFKFANPDTYQIITAGQDGKFSALAVATLPKPEARFHPSGTGYKTEDLDNITNFSQKSTLEGDMP